MPDQTHDFLINYITTYEGTGARQAEEDMRRAGDVALTTQTRFSDFTTTTQAQYVGFGDTITTTSRKIAAAVEEPGKAAQRSGHWLGRYMQRYLVRYFLIWQMMTKIQSITKDWSQAQQELARALANVQMAIGATDTEMRQHLGTLLEISRVSAIPVTQLATGFRPEQVGTTDLAARMARVTDMGYEQMFALVRQMRREYGLTGDALDRWADEFVAAHARSGMSISEFASEWQQGIREYGRGADDLGSLTRMLDATLKSGVRSLDDLSTAWGNYMSVVQATGEVGEAINQLTDLINTLTELEQRFGLITSAIGESWRAITEFLLPLEEFRWVEEKIAGVIQKFEQLKDVIYSLPTVEIFGWEIIGPSRPEEPITTTPEAGKTLYDLPGFRGRETQAEFARFQELLAGAEAELKGAGVDLPSDVTLSFLVGDDIKMIETNTAALLMVTEEMNERQKTGVFNWPGNVAMIAMGVGDATSRTTAIRRGPAAPPYTPLGGGAPYIPGANPSWNAFDIFAPSYQHGGVVQETGPAIVHKGETITPEGQSPINYLRLQSDIYMDGNHVAQSVSTRLGDQLYQTQRAAGG